MVLEGVEREQDCFQPARPLEWRQVRNCKVVPDRFALVECFLPHEAVCGEVGADTGVFAKKILELSNPLNYTLSILR